MYCLNHETVVNVTFRYIPNVSRILKKKEKASNFVLTNNPIFYKANDTPGRFYVDIKRDI